MITDLRFAEGVKKNCSHLCLDQRKIFISPFCLRVLLSRFRRKKLFKNEHFKLSISVVFPVWIDPHCMSSSAIYSSQLPASLLPNTFSLILRNGCFVGVNCSMNTARLSYIGKQSISFRDTRLLFLLVYHAERFEQLNDVGIPIDFSQLTCGSTIL